MGGFTVVGAGTEVVTGAGVGVAVGVVTGTGVGVAVGVATGTGVGVAVGVAAGSGVGVGVAPGETVTKVTALVKVAAVVGSACRARVSVTPSPEGKS